MPTKSDRSPELTERQYLGGIDDTKKKLAAQERFPVIIAQPMGSIKTQTTHLPVGINGFLMMIPYGVWCKVPESIYLQLVSSPTPGDPEQGFVMPLREQDVHLMPKNVETANKFVEWVTPSSLQETFAGR